MLELVTATATDTRLPSVLSNPNFASQVLVEVPPLASCEACVVIPVRNEATHIDTTLQALAQQVDRQGLPLGYHTYEVIVLANNCTDHTAEVVRKWAAQNPRLNLHLVEITLPQPDAHVGKARRLLMDEACRRLLFCHKPRGIIATTDGDSVVAPDWLAATKAEIASGADGVGGRIVIHRAERKAFEARGLYLRDNGYRFLVAELEHWYAAYPGDSWPRHHQHFGASFAITAAMYQRVGGLPPLPALEDVALYRAILRHDGFFRHSLAVRVTTSGRQQGRTDIGLAPKMRQWKELEAKKEQLLVEAAEVTEMRLQCRQRLRQLWLQACAGQVLNSRSVARLAEDLGIEAAWLIEALAQNQPFGALWEQLETDTQPWNFWSKRWPNQNIETVMSDLRARLQTLRGKGNFGLRQC